MEYQLSSKCPTSMILNCLTASTKGGCPFRSVRALQVGLSEGCCCAHARATFPFAAFVIIAVKISQTLAVLLYTSLVSFQKFLMCLFWSSSEMAGSCSRHFKHFFVQAIILHGTKHQ